MGEGRVNFCKISECDRLIHSKAIGFNEYISLLKPCKEVVVFAVELNVAKASVLLNTWQMHMCI